MKPIGIFLIWVILLLVAMADQCRTALGKPVPPVVTHTVVPDTQRASQAVVAFLRWYKAHIPIANRIQLVNQPVGKPYSVNLKNGERYLAYLQTSHGLTDAYLDAWRTYFKERDAGFRLNPQYEGPPTGFDYDLVLLNQEVDAQLAALHTLKIDKVTIMGNRATVDLTLFGSYEFRLVRRSDRWMINEILNIGAE